MGTPLQEASVRGYTEVVKLLKKFGADDFFVLPPVYGTKYY
jgi:hypothetical protein